LREERLGKLEELRLATTLAAKAGAHPHGYVPVVFYEVDPGRCKLEFATSHLQPSSNHPPNLSIVLEAVIDSYQLIIRDSSNSHTGPSVFHSDNRIAPRSDMSYADSHVPFRPCSDNLDILSSLELPPEHALLELQYRQGTRYLDDMGSGNVDMYC